MHENIIKVVLYKCLFYLISGVGIGIILTLLVKSFIGGIALW